MSGEGNVEKVKNRKKRHLKIMLQMSEGADCDTGGGLYEDRNRKT